MRDLFIVAARLMGVFQLYWAVMRLLQLGLSYTQFIGTLSVNNSMQFQNMMIVHGVMLAVMSAGLAWLLLTQTHWLADRLGFSQLDETPLPQGDALLQTGVTLVGLFLVLQAVPDLIRVVLRSELFEDVMMSERWAVDGPFLLQVLPEAIKLVLGIVFVLKAPQFVEWLSRRRSSMRSSGNGEELGAAAEG